MGTLRSMVISMVLILAAVLAWTAMVPRVRGISQPAVDVSSVARQVRQETSWGIAQPQLPAGWKATSVRFAPAGDGLRTWQKLSSRVTIQRSLLSRGSGARDLTTVLSGTASYSQLARFAETLRPVPAT